MPKHTDIFQDTVTYLQTGARLVGMSFTEPTDDWKPLAHFMGEDKQGMLPLSFENDEEKNFMSEAIAKCARMLDAKVVGLITSAWQVKVDKSEVDVDAVTTEVRPSQDPRREEVLVLSIISADKQVGYVARIIRDGKTPPTLGPWEKWDEGILKGRFVDPVVKELLLMAREKGKKLDG